MFNLTLSEHLRLMFGHVIQRQRAHSHLAHTNAQWSRWFRGAEALLMLGVATTATVAAFGRGNGYVIAAAILSGLALVALLMHLTFDVDGSADAHRTCATRLWRIQEQYRVLLSDLSDGVLDTDAGRLRRDALMNELHGVYENAPLADPRAYQTVARAILTADEVTLSDKDIDVFLPASLRKNEKAPALAP
jgi:SMODS and SLOG-associating 2TM effector domain family 4